MEIMEGYNEKKYQSDEDSDPDFRDDDKQNEAMQQYRDQRLQEIQEYNELPKYGYIKHITKQDYVQEINDAPEDVMVVLVLYQDYIEESVKLVEIMEVIAKKHVLVKFVKSIATKTIPDFADAHCPGILIYQNGEILHKMIPALTELGGFKVSVKIVEWVFSKKGILECDLEEDPRDDLYRMNITKTNKGDRNGDGDESDEEEREKKGYLHTHHWSSYKK
mmetsp:Transcript_25080/g.27822  ORF Transcript_25080/g.27822 Transcript_25080/m.27822 type:complete len:220 (+) Transcript_25080:109-768(+)|eukprot:CAMPEP_0205822742 /NCGR_PEP_ID=MMETSP0206-20130828/13819_1 /ASSEMBLY_ACC=CAM_ASM_000279 /TAXON_ID=36767 /ORGANISM="Euplotes focardii, Strain TN1" /LENGTH=219 /DNA_ID=CAMNT_0053119267 /DNA_START=109 /DNA_END=771 /DNA_ORIENTATION=+